MGYLMKIKLTNNGLLDYLSNPYIIQDSQNNKNKRYFLIVHTNTHPNLTPSGQFSLKTSSFVT